MNSVAPDSWGGGEKWMLNTAIGLRDSGHTVYCCGRVASRFVTRCAESNIMTFSIGIGSDIGPLTIFKLARFFRGNHIDAVVANFNKDVRLAGIARWLAGVPALVARNGLPILQNNIRYRLTYKFLACGIITNTVSIKERYLSYGWLDDDFITVIHNGVDTGDNVHFERGEILQKFPIPDRKPVIGSFGRLVIQKQPRVFLEVARRILNEWPDAGFLLVGDGPLRKDTERRAVELGVSDSVSFLGLQQDVMELYAICDLVLLTSRSEGLPNVVLEAMLGEKPVVAFDVGGVREIITSEKNGILVPPGDIDRMAQKAGELLRSEELRTIMGRRARRHVIEHFSLSTMIQEVERYLDKMIKKHRRR